MQLASDARRLARSAGLRDLRIPRLEDVDRRRAQLWLLSLLVALAIPIAMLAASLGWMPASLSRVLDLHTVRLALLALMVVVLGYVAEREITLRRLTGMLVDERVLTASLVHRVDELGHLVRVTRAMNSSLDLSRVLELIANSAHELLRARDAVILLVDTQDRGTLQVAATSGDAVARVGQRQGVADGMAGGAAVSRDALLLSDGVELAKVKRPVGSALAVPLQVREQLVGVLEVRAGTRREPFTEFDLRSVAVFAEAAASAITNARAHQRSLEEVEALREQDRQKDEFLALVTHELRTPLTSVIGLLTTITRRAGSLTPDKVSRYADVARTQGWRLDRLIDNILQSSRAQRGALEVNLREVDVAELLRRTVTGFREAHADRTVLLDVPDGPVLRRLDPDAVNRIIDNLVGNALKYTPPEAVVRLGMETGPEEVRLSVADGGPGIPAQRRDEVFGKFARADDPTGVGGLGLGLYVVRALADAHGGQAWLQESPDGGCDFRVVLASPPEPAEIVVASAASVRG